MKNCVKVPWFWTWTKSKAQLLNSDCIKSTIDNRKLHGYELTAMNGAFFRVVLIVFAMGNQPKMENNEMALNGYNVAFCGDIVFP